MIDVSSPVLKALFRQAYEDYKGGVRLNLYKPNDMDGLKRRLALSNGDVAVKTCTKRNPAQRRGTG